MTIDELKKLSQEQKRVMIADKQGWKKIKTGDWIELFRPNGSLVYGWCFSWLGDWCEKAIACLPDYYNDLNAMREVLNTLDDIQQRRYADNLKRLHKLDSSLCIPHLDLFHLLNSTTDQCADAYLMTVC